MTDKRQQLRDETVDRLRVMLRREHELYSCPDYFASDYRQSQVAEHLVAAPSPLNVVEQCARLVTDLSFAEPVDYPSKPTSSPNDARSSVETKNTSHIIFPNFSALDAHLIPNWRAQMCAWAYTVCESFGFDPSLVPVSFNILDRYLAKELLSEVAITHQDFQLFSMTALFVAIKINEPEVKLSVEALVDMSRGFFCHTDFEETELDMLEALHWKVMPPIPEHFLVEFRKLFPKASSGLVSRSRTIIHCAVSDSFFVPHKASYLALAAMMIAADQQHVPHEQLDEFRSAVRCLLDMNDADYRSVYEHLRKKGCY